MARIEVDADALQQVLIALSGQPHYIRELQMTRTVDENNPINLLVGEYNAWVEVQQEQEEAEQYTLLRRLEEYMEYAQKTQRFADVGFYEQLYEYIRASIEVMAERNRLLVLATKHCPRDHHDWQEILRIAGDA